MTRPNSIAARWLILGMILASSLLSCWCGAAWAGGLPDGRAYEMVTPNSNVSPAENHEADVYVPLAIAEGIQNTGTGGTRTKLPFQVSVDGNAIAYVGDSTVGGIGDGGAGLGSEYLGVRKSGGGWSQIGLQPAGRKYAFYQAFSSNLSVGVLNAGFAEAEAGPLTAGAPGGGYPILYTHDDNSGSEEGYQPFFSVTPTGLPEEFMTYHVPITYPRAGVHQLVYAGGLGAFGELLFEVNGALTGNAVEVAEANNLYISSGGALTLVNILPSGVSEANATFGAPRAGSGSSGDQPDFENVISQDGSRVFWTDLNTTVDAEDPSGLTRLFVREEPTSLTARTVQIDASQGPGVSGGGRFWTASRDGSSVLFTDENRLTIGSTAAPGEPDLYEYNVDNGHLRDLTMDSHEAANVQGVVGASENIATVYFVARGVLATNKNGQGVEATAGENNLYVLREGGQLQFIAILSSKDNEEAIEPGGSGGFYGDWQPGLGHRTAEVAPDGNSVVFESNNQSVGKYSPEVNGNKLEEVYVFQTGGGGRLFCVSCSPSHTPPQLNAESGRGIGGFLPVSWSFTYLPQWMSMNGSRVFFDSSEPLVNSDTNGTQDVYEWEQDGSGGCAEEVGCVSLLSGGSNPSSSSLAGASASGDDVFVITRARLTPEDGNEAYNLFDARVGSVTPVTSLACAEGGCQGVPAPPPVFATPPSVTFNGVGNFPPPVKILTKPKPKHKKAKTEKKKKTKRKKKHARAKGVVVELGRHGR